jgi:hypothetical protein
MCAMTAMSWSLNSTATAHRNNILNVRMDAVAGGLRSIRELNGTYLIMLERLSGHVRAMICSSLKRPTIIRGSSVGNARFAADTLGTPGAIPSGGARSSMILSRPTPK